MIHHLRDAFLWFQKTPCLMSKINGLCYRFFLNIRRKSMKNLSQFIVKLIDISHQETNNHIPSSRSYNDPFCSRMLIEIGSNLLHFFPACIRQSEIQLKFHNAELKIVHNGMKPKNHPFFQEFLDSIMHN